MGKTKETSEQSQAIKDRFSSIGSIIKDHQDKIKILKIEIGSHLDAIRDVKKESAPLLAYLRAAGIEPRAKHTRKPKGDPTVGQG